MEHLLAIQAKVEAKINKLATKEKSGGKLIAINARARRRWFERQHDKIVAEIVNNTPKSKFRNLGANRNMYFTQEEAEYAEKDARKWMWTDFGVGGLLTGLGIVSLMGSTDLPLPLAVISLTAGIVGTVATVHAFGLYETYSRIIQAHKKLDDQGVRAVQKTPKAA